MNPTILGGEPYAVFVHHSDQIYVTVQMNERMLVGNQNTNFSHLVNLKLSNYSDVFVGRNGDIYYEDSSLKGKIQRWSVQQKQSLHVVSFDDFCYGLFIDNNNTLYCSQNKRHLVKKISLDNLNDQPTIAAGNGSEGPTASQVNQPWGIFVDGQYNLYVADAINNRIQRFAPGNTIGVTVAGKGTPPNLTLHYPTDVVVDRHGYIYIADNMNNRTVRVKDQNWKCIVGCTGQSGAGMHQFAKSTSLHLDSHGNLYVNDEKNRRVQMFALKNNGCCKSLSIRLHSTLRTSSSQRTTSFKSCRKHRYHRSL